MRGDDGEAGVAEAEGQLARQFQRQRAHVARTVLTRYSVGKVKSTPVVAFSSWENIGSSSLRPSYSKW